MDRRTFLLGTGVAGAVATVTGIENPRVERLIALSRDRGGQAHIDRVAFFDRGLVTGTLAMTTEEATVIADAMASDVSALEHGVRIAGTRFILVGADDAVVHAVRPGEFATLRATGDGFVVATSASGMAHGMAVNAVYRFVHAN
jgi:hypothetical protein